MLKIDRQFDDPLIDLKTRVIEPRRTEPTSSVIPTHDGFLVVATNGFVSTTPKLMELFETDDEEEVRRELARRGVTPHESAGRMFVSDS